MMKILLILITFLRFQHVLSSFNNQTILFGYSIRFRGDEYGIKYKQTLQNFLGSLSSQATKTGFHNITTPTCTQFPNKHLYGLYLCRGDVDPQSCHDCVNLAKQYILKNYPYGKEALVRYDHCMVRYSNVSIFGKLDFNMWTSSWVHGNITGDRVWFRRILANTMNGLAVQATNARQEKKFATRVVKLTNHQTLYALVQCTPDLSTSDCHWCLTNAIRRIRRMGSSSGGKVMCLNCMARFEVFPFFYRNKIKAPRFRWSLDENDSTVVSLRVRLEPLPLNNTVDSSRSSLSRTPSNSTRVRLRARIETTPFHGYTTKSKGVTNSTVIKQKGPEDNTRVSG